MDPSSEFAISVAIGAAHVLSSALGSLGRATRSPVAAAVLALPIFAAYLSAVTLAFAVRAAADCCTSVVVASSIDAAAVAQQAATAILGWVADLVVRIAVSVLLFGALAISWALLHLACTGGALP